MSVVAALACHNSPPLDIAPVPPVPQQQLSPPSLVSTTITSSPVAALSAPDTVLELRVDIDTHGTEVDVKQLLAFLADKAHISLIYSPEINKKVRLRLIDVPVSDALQAVLAAANLTLESTTAPSSSRRSTAVVFYQLPVNVDSLSVDAIMKRFGVGRAMAEMIVQSRTTKP